MLGDLVYCKGDNSENVSGGMPECEDDSYNVADDSNHLDEISGMDLPEERNNLVKVWCHSPSIIFFIIIIYTCTLLLSLLKPNLSGRVRQEHHFLSLKLV